MITLDAVGFAESACGTGTSWDFDVAAGSILALLEHLDQSAVVIGDSMGGGPTGLRCALSGSSRIVGVVAVGTSCECESPGEFCSPSRAWDGSIDKRVCG